MKSLFTRLFLSSFFWLSAIACFGQSVSVIVNPNTICLGQNAQVYAILSGVATTNVTSYTFYWNAAKTDSAYNNYNTGTPVKNNVNKLFANAGVYKISVRVQFSNRADLSAEVWDTVYNLPTAGFALTNLDSQCFKGNNYCFINQSVPGAFPGLPIGSTFASFGDGDSVSVGSGVSYCHSFTIGNSVFQVTLRTTDIRGCWSKVYKNIFAAPDMNANFTINGTPKCDTTPYIFINQTPVSPTALAWFAWYFGDGESFISSNPPVPSEVIGPNNKWNGFTHKYTKSGLFDPILVIKHRYFNCTDSFVYSRTGNPLPENLIINLDIATKQATQNLASADSVCFGNLNKGRVCLFNKNSLSGVNVSPGIIWNFADPFANPPGSDKFYNTAEACYTYKKLGQYFPTLTVGCSGIPNKVFTYANGVKILGPKVQVEDPSATGPVLIKPFLKNQCGPDLPVEFTNASQVYLSNKLYMRWDFSDDYSPRCTSFSVPDPSKPVSPVNANSCNGCEPYTTSNDMLNRTLGKFIVNGITYTGRVNCNYSHDTLPIHMYNNWEKLYKWFVNGHDFPPYDQSANGWTKDPSQVTWPGGNPANPTGKKLVHPDDTASWGKPIFSAGPNPVRIDTMISMWPADIIPNKPITLTKDIPDPKATAAGYWNAYISAGHRIDTNGFIFPNDLSNLPDGTQRRYKGNTPLPNLPTNTSLYQYFFKRQVEHCIDARLLMRDSIAMQSAGPFGNCSDEAIVTLPLVGVDAHGLGKSGNECIGLFNGLNGGNVKIHFNGSAGNPGLSPECSAKTFLLFNHDSLLDRKDNTPCALDGFVQFDGTSPMFTPPQATTPGGSRFPPFNNAPNFNPLTVWLNINGDVNNTHYMPNGAWPYSNSPIDPKGFVTVGLIVGTGCATFACNSPACISDTIWYHNFFHFINLDASFTYRKVGGYPAYGNGGKLPGQDFTYDATTKEPWSRLYGKGDIIQFESNIKQQDFVLADVWDWGDGRLTVDSFYTNQTDAFFHLNPSNPNDSAFFVKNTFPLNRIRYEYNTETLPWTLISQFVPYPVGVNVLNLVRHDTVWQCFDIMHFYAPLSIKTTHLRIDSAFFIHPVNHQFVKSTSEMKVGPGTMQRRNDITPVQHNLITNNLCSNQGLRWLVIGVMDTFTIKNNDAVLCVGENAEFSDSIHYWYPKDDGLHNPKRPLDIGEYPLLSGYQTGTNPNTYWGSNTYKTGMSGYPADSIKIRANASKGGKLDTFFYERIYWDFESDGVIDYAGINAKHKFTSAGRFKVSMISRDSVGYFDTCFMYVDVVKPNAHFTSKSLFQCGEAAQFHDSSYLSSPCINNTGTSCDQIVLRHWWFGDKGYGPNAWSSTLPDPMHAYNKKGWFKVQESILTLEGCADTLRKDIYLLGPRPRIKLLTDSVGCAPYTVKVVSYPFDSSGFAQTGATQIFSGRADHIGDVVTFKNPDTISITYNTAGAYNISAIGWDKFPANDCPPVITPDTINGIERPIRIYVNPKPVKPVISGKTAVYASQLERYSIIINSGNTYLWKVGGGVINSNQGDSAVFITWGLANSNAWISVDESNGLCLTRDTLKVTIGNVGINEVAGLTDIKLFPNPTANGLTFTASTLYTETWTFDLYSVDGKLILSKIQRSDNNLLNIIFDVSNLSSGAYFVHAHSETGNGRMKFIKK
ncbi:MAG: T9SS type A sorting domain-containing protein [Bacteroidota bacterium]|nr:T9SS type A sorting domain-containing protein [Bacteroidota bacterium]